MRRHFFVFLLLCAPVLAAPIRINTSALPNAQVGRAYNQTLSATGGKKPLAWSIAAGALPDGLSLDSSSGTISGTPSTAGTAAFTVQVSDKDNNTDSQPLTLTVDAAPAPPAPALTVTTSSLPSGILGSPYSASLTASGGTGVYAWSIAGGALPAGVTLDPSGAISGTPAAAGTSNFTAQVRDSANSTARQALSISIAAPPLNITTSSLPAATAGVAYSAALSASGGAGGNTWSVVSGSLPSGLALDPSGAIGGTPAAAGAFNFTAQVRDSANSTARQALSITVAPPALTITTSSLPAATVGVAYSATLSASGGAGGNTWSVVSGSLPSGLALDPSGTIGGTPSAAGTSNFTAQVRDSANSTARQALSITVAPPALTITTSSLPSATVGVAYSAALSASGGAGGNTWSVVSGTLPSGLTLDPSGAISGTPAAAGTSTFTAQVRDSANTSATKALSITVAAPTLTVTTSSVPAATVGAPYSATLSASGGTGSYSWSVASGSLPPGLSLNAQGAIAGTPTAAGTSNFTAQVKDSANATATRALTITVNPPALTITTASLPNGTLAAAYSAQLAASGGAGGNTWSVVAGSLPLGLTLGNDGTISGIPLLPGTSNFTAQVRDSAGTTASRALSLTIGANPVTITTQALPGAEQGVPYSQTLAASGGTGQYRWSITDGALPAGLALDAGGRISGTPTGATSTFTAQATDSSGQTGTKLFTLNVAPAPTFGSGATLPSGSLGVSYSATATVSGGQPPYTITLTSGQLPPGLTLNTSTGEISGKPSQAGAFPFTLTARDAAGAQAQQPFTITVAAGLTITTAPALPAAALAVVYSATLAAAGGAPPYTWSATAGSLPAGVTLHPDGKIDGTPGAAGSFAFTAAVTDANGSRASKDFTLTVASGLTITTAPQLPPAVPGAPYTTPLAASGGRPPYTWSITAGALPAGITMNSGTGALSGTTSALGTYNFTAAVTDAGNVTATKAFTLTVAPGLTFTSPASLPDAVAGTAYSFTLRASGGAAPYSWRITDGALAAGLSLNGASGVVSGTPSAAGTFNFTIEVSDAGNLKGARVHTIVVALPSLPRLTLSGLPLTLAPLQQPPVTLAVTTAYPVAVTGRLNLAFAPASGMPDDPAIQFSSGGRSVSFTIPANTTSATFPLPQLAVQSGSVAGTLQFTVDSLQAGGAPVSAPAAAVANAQVAAAAPAVRAVTVNHTSSGFEVQVVGLSDTRELTTATVKFRPLNTEVSIPLSDAARTWFGNAGSNQYGGQFTLTLPFTINGTVSLDSVSVVLTNSVGASTETAGPY